MQAKVSKYLLSLLFPRVSHLVPVKVQILLKVLGQNHPLLLRQLPAAQEVLSFSQGLRVLPLFLTCCRTLFLLQAAQLSPPGALVFFSAGLLATSVPHSTVMPAMTCQQPGCAGAPAVPVPTAGLLVYFGYGIWHSKENLREPRPQRVSARYVVFPGGSLEERVQAVQPSSQPATGLPDTDTDDCKR